MPGQRYQCIGRQCDQERVLPERPSDARDTVKMGCERCGYVTTHYPVGRVPPTQPAGGRA